MDLIQGEWDPEAHDRQMAELFNDDYYDADDPESGKLIKTANVEEIDGIEEDNLDLGDNVTTSSGKGVRTFKERLPECRVWGK